MREILYILYVDQLSIRVIPTKRTVGKGDTAQFTAIASGINMNNFRYQWRKRGSNSLPDKVSGVNGAVITIPNVVESDRGKYYCIVTNEWNRKKTSDDVALVLEGKYNTNFGWWKCWQLTTNIYPPNYCCNQDFLKCHNCISKVIINFTAIY